jgi:hypothetical protein
MRPATMSRFLGAGAGNLSGSRAGPWDGLGGWRWPRVSGAESGYQISTPGITASQPATKVRSAGRFHDHARRDAHGQIPHAAKRRKTTLSSRAGGASDLSHPGCATTNPVRSATVLRQMVRGSPWRFVKTAQPRSGASRDSGQVECGGGWRTRWCNERASIGDSRLCLPHLRSDQPSNLRAGCRRIADTSAEPPAIASERERTGAERTRRGSVPPPPNAGSEGAARSLL